MTDVGKTKHRTTRRPIRWRPLTMPALFVALAFLAAGASAAQAQSITEPSPERGHVLADRLCKGCHLVEGSSVGSVPVGPPSLRAIANQPGQSGQRIRNALIQPFHPMPDLQLSNDEILELLAYLESMRTNPQVPRLIEPEGRLIKPVLPPRT